MNSMLRLLRLRSSARLALLTLLCGTAGCFNPFDPRLAIEGGNSKPPPVPDSPIGIIQLFQWCWRNRAYDTYQELFTDNYRFEFATGDSAGDFYRDTPWTRSDELATAQHLFVTGTPSQPPATSITLDFTQDLRVDVDPRPGKTDTTYHRLVTAQVLLRVNLSDGTQEVRGPVYFYVIRGDSAIIPPELIQRGFKPDSHRWYIEQWVDGTLQGGAFAAERAPLWDRARGAPTLRYVATSSTAPPRPATGSGAAPVVSLTFGALKVEFRGVP
jgi:hypothetical protein